MRLWAISVGVSVAAFAILQALTWRATGGVFEYPLDDVYIHLAIANSIMRGEYGINAGEYASAASSVIYPILLAPFSGLGIERAMPLVINLVALLGVAITWARIIAVIGAAGPAALVLAALGPVALNFAGTAFVGMEHSLHVWASLVAFAGILRLVQHQPVGWGFYLAVVAAPLIRFEGLGLSLLSIGVLAFYGQWLRALLLAAFMALPLGAFIVFLNAHDIGPLPTSVIVKQALVTGEDPTLLNRISLNVMDAMRYITAQLMAVGCFLLLIASLLPRLSGQARMVAVIGLAAGLGHIFFGRFGWGFRYEGYVMAVVTAALLYALVSLNLKSTHVLIAVLFTLLPLSLIYSTELSVRGPATARMIHLQQYQMARIAQELVQKPVAVNDIGRVAWRNSNYVLDLYGLASREAFRTRTSPDRPRGWAGTLAEKHDVAAVMVFDYLFKEGRGPGWVPLGQLKMASDYDWFGTLTVDLIATSPAEAEELAPKLRAFAATLPEGAWIEFAP